MILTQELKEIDPALFLARMAASWIVKVVEKQESKGRWGIYL